MKMQVVDRIGLRKPGNFKRSAITTVQTLSCAGQQSATHPVRIGSCSRQLDCLDGFARSALFGRLYRCASCRALLADCRRQQHLGHGTTVLSSLALVRRRSPA